MCLPLAHLQESIVCKQTSRVHMGSSNSTHSYSEAGPNTLSCINSLSSPPLLQFGNTSVCNAFAFSLSGITSLNSETFVLFSRLVISLLLSTYPTSFHLLYGIRQFGWYWHSTCIPQSTKLKTSLAAFFIEKHLFNLGAFQAITPAT